jgi:hypothetical protein
MWRKISFGVFCCYLEHGSCRFKFIPGWPAFQHLHNSSPNAPEKKDCQSPLTQIADTNTPNVSLLSIWLSFDNLWSHPVRSTLHRFDPSSSTADSLKEKEVA